jgi:gliding motility-associated-like protein
VGDLLNTPGEFCYRITAVENGNGYTLPGLPESNRLCLTQEPVIWVPNAFLINGVNTIFKPVISFANPENYRLQVYSRWGNMIFQTDDLTEGWNGEYRGERVPEGMYAWFLSISDGAGRIYEERGTVMMMVGAED